MTSTESLFKQIIAILIHQEVTTQLQSEHWPAPNHDSEIYNALLAEGVTPVHIANAFAELKDYEIYDPKSGDFSESGPGWGIANDRLFISNPFSHLVDELLENQSRGLLKFSSIGLLVGDEDSGTTRNIDLTELDKSINEMLETALKAGASDIHISPRTKKHLSIMFRVDGVRTPYRHKVTMDEYADWSNRLLSKADKTGGSPTAPLDLKFSYTWKGKEVQVRLAASPVIKGGEAHYYFVLRLLNPSGQLRKLEQIGFPTTEHETINALCKSPKGLIIITGPTGSGKTTTLYAMLQQIQETRPGDSIQTLEDPVEVEIQGIEQTQINTGAGMTFAAGLKAKLRQDPDVILVGELRDLETTKLAIEASMTGHLVLATLHTNSAVLAISRLTNLGVDPSTLADSLLAVSAQRMVRKVCQHCATEREFGENRGQSEKYASLRHSPNSYDMVKVANLQGCEYCEGGYAGRIVVSELMIIDPWTQEQILARRPANEIEETHRRHQYMTMWENGIQLVKDGITTIDELEARLSPLASYGKHFTYGRETKLL